MLSQRSVPEVKEVVEYDVGLLEFESRTKEAELQEGNADSGQDITGRGN